MKNSSTAFFQRDDQKMRVPRFQKSKNVVGSGASLQKGETIAIQASRFSCIPSCETPWVMLFDLEGQNACTTDHVQNTVRTAWAQGHTDGYAGSLQPWGRAWGSAALSKPSKASGNKSPCLWAGHGRGRQ